MFVLLLLIGPITNRSRCCWSLFLVPLELSLNVGRAPLSAIFSLATSFFTLSLSFVVPALISRIRPRTMCILATILATTGVFVASFCSTAMSIIPLYIGSAGDMTRLSTGYTFLNIQEHSKYIAENIGNISKAKLFKIKKKYDFLDNIFLKVLRNNSSDMGEIFFKMFNSSPKTAINFLSNKSNFLG